MHTKIPTSHSYTNNILCVVQFWQTNKKSRKQKVEDTGEENWKGKVNELLV